MPRPKNEPKSLLTESVKIVPTPFDLPTLSNLQFDQATEMAKRSGVPLSQCPTCLTTREEIAPDVWVWNNGTYRYKNKTYVCDCQTQMALHKHYLLANIGDQYQRLNWDDYNGDGQARDVVETYLEKWTAFKQNGMGLEFNSAKLGVGKTFAATHIGKELIKRGERVYFIPFLEIISLYEDPRRDELEDLLKNVTVLILDEVISPYTQAQAGLFASKFEELIRHRTNYNLVVIMTTNLEPAKLHEIYPRTYSLLEAKQLRVTMDGKDVRQGIIASENLELAMNNEVRPIT